MENIEKYHLLGFAELGQCFLCSINARRWHALISVEKAAVPCQNGMCAYAQKSMAKGNPTRIQIGAGDSKLSFFFTQILPITGRAKKHTSASLERLSFCTRYFCMKEAGKSTSLQQGIKGCKLVQT